MDSTFYLRKFHLATAEIPEKILSNKGLKLSVEIVLESVALKVYHPEWSGNPESPLDAEGRIFFQFGSTISLSVKEKYITIFML
jgi:hypothetical protein